MAELCILCRKMKDENKYIAQECMKRKQKMTSKARYKSMPGGSENRQPLVKTGQKSEVEGHYL